MNQPEHGPGVWSQVLFSSSLAWLLALQMRVLRLSEANFSISGSHLSKLGLEFGLEWMSGCIGPNNRQITVS